MISFHGYVLFSIFDMLKWFYIVENLFKMTLEWFLSDFDQMVYELIHESIHAIEKLLNWFMNQLEAY